MLLRAGHRLTDVIGYATTTFARQIDFPAPIFLRSLVWFGDCTAGDVHTEIRTELEMAVHDLELADIPLVEPFPGMRGSIFEGMGACERARG